MGEGGEGDVDDDVLEVDVVNGLVLDVDVRLGATGAGPAVDGKGRQAVICCLHIRQTNGWNDCILPKGWPGPSEQSIDQFHMLMAKGTRLPFCCLHMHDKSRAGFVAQNQKAGRRRANTLQIGSEQNN